MAKKKSLAEIKRLFQRKKYGEVVRILEPQIFRFRESFDYYSLLGLSCLYLNDGGGASSYLNRARQLKDDDVRTLLGIAAIHLKKRNIDEALKLWLRVTEIDPKNRVAARALERVRRGMSEEQVTLLVDSGKISLFYPQEPKHFPVAVFLVGVLVTLGGVAAYCVASGTIVLPGSLLPATGSAEAHPGENSPPPPREGIAAVELSRDAMRTDVNVTARFMFTEPEVDEVWKKANAYFRDYRDNLAVVELNRLFLSNASNYIKESARRLKSYARTPGFKDFLDFRDNFDFVTVSADPVLYDGCFVLWRGTIANLLISLDNISFRLLVGSYDNRTFQGDVQVMFDVADKFENNYYIELLGKVVVDGGRFRLKGILNRRLIAPTPR